MGGVFQIPVDQVFPESSAESHNLVIAIVTPSIPVIGVILAYFLFLRRSIDLSALLDSKPGRSIRAFLFSHWAMDWLYHRLFVVPYKTIARLNQSDAVDMIYEGASDLTNIAHYCVALTQTGRLRWYAAVMGIGLVLLIAIILRVQ